MVDIFSQVFTVSQQAFIDYANSEQGKISLYNKSPIVSPSYEPINTTFPYITIEEKSNIFAQKELGGNEKFSLIMYEINIYDNSIYHISVCRNLANVCNETLSRRFGFKRIFQEPMFNVADSTIYRILQRYNGYIDNQTGIIYNNIK